MFLVGEVPSAMGLVGVAVVSIAGYKLGVMGAADTAALAQQASKAGKPKVPLLPLGSHAGPGLNGSASSSNLGRLSQAGGQYRPEEQLLIPAADLRDRLDELHYHGQQQQQGRAYQRQPVQLSPSTAANGPELHTANGSWGDTGTHGDDQHPQQPQHGHQPSDGGSMRSASSSAGGAKQKSAWAIAYYKQKSPPVGVWEATRGGLQSAAQQLLATAGVSPRSRAAMSSVHNVFGASGMNGQHHSASFNSSSSNGLSSAGSPGSSTAWAGDSQAKDSTRPDSKRGVGVQRPLARAPARRWPHWIRAPLRRLQQALKGLADLLSGPTAGPTLVLIVAFLYSLTASFDKLGMSSSTSTAFYIMMQRLLIAAVSMVYLLLGTPRTLRHLYKDAVLLVALSLAEQLAIVLYFKAIQNILVGVGVGVGVSCRAGRGGCSVQQQLNCSRGSLTRAQRPKQGCCKPNPAACPCQPQQRTARVSGNNHTKAHSPAVVLCCAGRCRTWWRSSASMCCCRRWWGV